MPTRLDKPLSTKLCSGWESFKPDPGSIYVFGTSVEERSIHPTEWEKQAYNVNFVRVLPLDETKISPCSECRLQYGEIKVDLLLRAGEKMISTLVDIPGDRIFLDITGLSHGVWAPFLKAAIKTGKPLSVVYAEPRNYSFSPTPTEAEIFDLSEEIRDILPIPGFSSLKEPMQEDRVVFVPLLGFEGRRLAYVNEKVQAPIRTTFPIIGIPGFRMEYPFHTYLGNRNVLKIKDLYIRVIYAIANSASDVYQKLNEIAEQYPGYLMKIAPIGTKPHALGAILFYLTSTSTVEIIYDHPIRKSFRTVGSANILIYNINCLLNH